LFDVKWSPEFNCVELGRGFNDKEKISPPRPVFYQELDLLGFDKYWDYPKIETPILWAIGRSYFYRGTRIATVNGGNLYDPPELIVEFQNDDGSKNRIEPVNYDKLISLNKQWIKLLENEASEFIDTTYQRFHHKVDAFAVAYSGGKDSQVILDLVSKTLAVDQYKVIFGDTTMELPCTYRSVEITQDMYQERFPSFQIHHAKPKLDAIEYWKLFAPPSTTHRWCCTVCKTSPFAEKLFDLIKPSVKGKVVVFEGVRAAESSKRSYYKRISQNKKYSFQTNAEVILDWNNTEVYLYILLNELYLNEGYKWGFLRVGCSMCPYGSEWFEHLAYRIYPDYMKRYIYEITQNLDFENCDGYITNEYIKKGSWKVRSGGRGNKQHVQMDVVSTSPLTIVIGDFMKALNGLRLLGRVIVTNNNGSKLGMLLDINNETLECECTMGKGNSKLVFNDISNTSKIVSLIKKAIVKSQFCVECGLCNLLCPSRVFSIKMHDNECMHCNKCFGFDGIGCLRADSLYVTIKDNKMKNIATSRYQNFGLRTDMIDFYFTNHDDWLTQFNLGGKPMRDSFVCWMKDSGLIDGNKQNTELSFFMKNNYTHSKSVIWELIWVNLCYGSPLIQWFTNNVATGMILTSDTLVSELQLIDGAPTSTTKNAISSLLSLLRNGQIDRTLGLVEANSDRQGSIIKLRNSNKISHSGFLYALYRFCEVHDKFDLSLSDLFDSTKSGSPAMLFSFDRDHLRRYLKRLDGISSGIVTVQFVKNLDNVFVSKVSTSYLLDSLIKINGSQN